MKSYTFSEYKQMIENENISKYIIVEKFLNSLSKVEYKKIIILIAIFMHKGFISYGITTEVEISNVANQILDLLMIFAQYGCMCMGIKSIIENALQGADFRQATTAGIQYFLIYILLTFYPKLFSMIKM
jgi:succinate dehydrogenase hydrophobic anchor subunit